MDSLKKSLKRDYAFEKSDNLLPCDKFEINPRQLKFKDVLGSGAYGIVRLASLQDEFGAFTDVAVKMMKGIYYNVGRYDETKYTILRKA